MRMLDRGGAVVVAWAEAEAEASVMPQMLPEHLLLGVLREDSDLTARVVRGFGLTLDSVRSRIVSTQVYPSVRGPEQVPSLAKLARAGRLAAEYHDWRLSRGAEVALAVADEEAGALDQNWVGPEHILLGLGRDDGAVGEILRDHGATADLIRAEVYRMEIGPGPPGARGTVVYWGNYSPPGDSGTAASS